MTKNNALSRRFALAAIAAGIMVSVLVSRTVAQAPPSPDQMVAALKQNLAESQKRLRQYEWIETTALSLKGEEKSRKQQRVYYGADGKLVKLPMGEPPPEAASGGRGRRGGRLKERVVENKKDEMQEYMERAVGLVHQYVPPNPEAIDAAKHAGKVAMRPGQSGHARLEFTDFIKPADLFAVEIDAATNHLAGLIVSSYLDERTDVVALNVQFGALADGTSYASQVTLDAKAKHMTVVIQNSGYRLVGQ